MSSRTSSKTTRPKQGKSIDSRFANFETDPRFRLPSKKRSKVTIDERFASVLKDSDFAVTAKVDRYGRKLKSENNKKALQRLYDVEVENDGKEVDDDDEVRRELEAADKKYDPARHGGFSSSESDPDSDDDGEVEEESTVRGMQRVQDEAAAAEEGEVTNRIAIVSLDWDNIKSTDLYALFSSFLPSGSRIEKVSIYPSEFGKSRMAQENTSGPPREIWSKKASAQSEDEASSDDESSDEEEEDDDEKIKKQLYQEQEGDDQDFDMDKLREYQLDRLRYYYAVMVLSDKKAAKEIYDKVDGTELLSSSNHLDLRFVPDDTTFDDEPRDECDGVPAGYKPVEFTTRALNHSKVELTWDMDPEASRRSETLKKAFTGSRDDINENDLRAYLGSDSSDEEDDVVEQEEQPAEEGPISKKEAARRKLRAAFGLTDESSSKTKTAEAGPVGDMQITFTPALSENAAGKGHEGEETTIEKYMRKERERKSKRKEKAVAKREGREIDDDDGNDAGQADQGGETAEDLGFDDPFFTSEAPAKASKSAMRKEERLKKRATRGAEAAENAAEKAKLELLMADDTNEKAEHLDHFDMREIERAQKRKGKKGKKAKEVDDRGGLQTDFNINVDDPRFQAVFSSHEFAIDPSNPKFKATQGMKKLLEEGRKKRKAGAEEDGDHSTRKKAKGDDLDSLVASVRRKKAGRGDRT